MNKLEKADSSLRGDADLGQGIDSAEVTMSCYAHALPTADGSSAALLDSTLFSR